MEIVAPELTEINPPNKSELKAASAEVKALYGNAVVLNWELLMVTLEKVIKIPFVSLFAVLSLKVIFVKSISANKRAIVYPFFEMLFENSELEIEEGSVPREYIAEDVSLAELELKVDLSIVTVLSPLQYNHPPSNRA